LSEGATIINLYRMSNRKERTVSLYKNYFAVFYERQNQKVRNKILWTFRLIETLKYIPTEYLKHLEGTKGLYEIRIKHGSDIYRIFCFFEKKKLIVITNGYQKKSKKASKSEIEKALKIKEEYETEEQFKKP